MSAARFHHVSLSVADLPAQEAWYADTFGPTQVEERLELSLA
ncbi:VOC family protein [Streptomyces sp. NBC_00483]